MPALCQHFQRASPLKLLGQFQFNFSKGVKKIIYLIQVTCPRWTAWLYIGKNLEKSFYMPIYVTEYQSNAPSGPGCIAHLHFGTVTLCLQKIDKFILKTNVKKLILRDSLRAQGSDQDLMILLLGLTWKRKPCLIPKFHRTDLDI